MFNTKTYFIIILLLNFLSCSKKDMNVQVYQTKKIKVKTAPMQNSGNDDLSSVVRNFSWTTPKGWIEKPGNSIRVGSFLIKGEGKYQDKTADASIVVLGGRAGGLLMNINRWRDQISLGPIVEKDLESFVKLKKGKLGPFKYLFIKNPKTKEGILASIFMREEKTVFVKMTGSISFLKSQSSIFLDFSRQIYEN